MERTSSKEEGLGWPTWGDLRASPTEVSESKQKVDWKTGRGIALYDISNDVSLPQVFRISNTAGKNHYIVSEDHALHEPSTRFVKDIENARWANYQVTHDDQPVDGPVRVLVDIQDAANDILLSGRRVMRGVKFQRERKFQARIDRRHNRLYLCTVRRTAEQVEARMNRSGPWQLVTEKWNLSKLDGTGRLKDMIHAWASSVDGSVKTVSMYGHKVNEAKTIKWDRLTSVDAVLSIKGASRHIQISEDRRIRTSDGALKVRDLIRLAEEFDTVLKGAP